jgi:hypothetical protein
MSVIVKGMKMPDSCAVCRFAGRGGYRMERVVCMFTGENEDAQNVDRLPNCPLVALPDKHGRLVDADYFKIHLVTCEENGRPLHRMFTELDELIDVIDNVPTIVEAEGDA